MNEQQTRKVVKKFFLAIGSKPNKSRRNNSTGNSPLGDHQKKMFQGTSKGAKTSRSKFDMEQGSLT